MRRKSVREGEKKKGGKEQGREEREKGRKGRRGQEGRKKEEREVEEGGGELVEKDVTGWTEVMRNKRKKMVQMFVKVDEMKTVAMEVSLEDKVQKILNIMSKSDRDVYATSGGRILKGSDKLKSCEVRDGSTVEVTSRMRGGGKHKDKKGKEERRAHESRGEERRALEAREEQRRAQEAREEQRRAQEAPELRRSEREVNAQEERTEQERKVEAQGEQEEDVNSVHDECHVSNRHMTWWHNAWWIRVDNGPHMRSARGPRRTWRAARQAAKQVRDRNSVGETRWEERARLKKGERGETGQNRKSNEAALHLYPPRLATTRATTAAHSSYSSNSSRSNVSSGLKLLRNHEYVGQPQTVIVVDWTAMKAVTPVKNWEQCDSCWTSLLCQWVWRQQLMS